jgi:hypothetical protein
MPFPIRGEPKAGSDILQLKLGKVLDELLGGHPRGELIQDVVHRDPESSDARLSAPLAGLDRDTFSIINGDLQSILRD